MAAMAAILENRYLFCTSPEVKGQFTRNLVGSIWVTCRSKIVKFVLIGNSIWPPQWPAWKSILNFFWTVRSIDSILDRKYQGDLWIENSYYRSDRKSKMVTLAAMLKIYFELFYHEPKGQLTQNFIGSIEVTYRSKVLKSFWLEIQDGRHFENLYWTSSLEPKGQLARNLSNIW